MKKIAIVLIFIIATLFLFFKYEEIIRQKTRLNIAAEYNKNYYNNIDVFFLGNSAVNWSISPMYIWNKYGILSYNRGIEQQSLIETLHITKSIFRKYKPKLIIVDIFESYWAYNKYLNLNGIANMIEFPYNLSAYNDYFKYLKHFDNKLDIFNELENINLINRFHNRWKVLNKYDFGYAEYMRGVWPVHGVKNYDIPKITNEEKKIDEYNLYILSKIVKIAEENNCKILFIRTPYGTTYGNSYINFFKKYAEQNKWNFINYNDLYKNLNFDYKTDFESTYHLNIYGARKVMDHLVPYIIENYNIPIRKDDPKYASWNEDYIKYARYENKVLLKGIKSFQEWQKQAYYDNYTMLISTNGNNVLNRLPQDMKDKFTTLGLNKFETDKKNQKYVAIIDNNKVFFEEISDKKAEYKGRMNNIVNLLISSEDKKATINVSGKPRAKNKYGINFVIYDKVNREIVDSIWLDPKNFNQVRR